MCVPNNSLKATNKTSDSYKMSTFENNIRSIYY